MTSAGYSGTPLPKKLGITEGSRVLLADAPDGFTLDLPPGARVQRRASGGAAYDVVLLFATREVDLRRRFGPLSERLTPAGGLWVCWPKRTAKGARLNTDLDEHAVREIGLATGLVDNKVCAVDVTWSGLRFVVRKADRAGRPARAADQAK